MDIDDKYTTFLDLNNNHIKEIENITNVNELYLYNNEITEIKNLDDLDNINKLYLDNNKITEIKGLNSLVNLKILNFCNNQLTEIKGLDNLVNLHSLDLSYNYIIEIKGLDNLTNLKELHLENNKIREINGLSNLTNLILLDLSRNKIKEIIGLDNLINITQLFLSVNKITEIKGLDNLTKLHKIFINNNKISEIKGLDKLINLLYLYLYNNEIIEIKGLDNLVNLEELLLGDNIITEIKGLNNLTNLYELHINENSITELPISLCHLNRMYRFRYFDNPVEYIPLPVQRWLDRFNRNITENLVYGDKQNIHNHHIQNSFKNSLNNILKDNNLMNLNDIKQQILDNEILTEQSKRELLNYCDDGTQHCTYLITYSDLLIYVWSRIINNKDKDEILKVLNQEISDGLCMCFTGRLTRLLNTLVGFYNDIEIQISDSEQITNIIISLKNKYEKNELKIELKKALIERQYSESIINEWLEYI